MHALRLSCVPLLILASAVSITRFGHTREFSADFVASGVGGPAAGTVYVRGTSIRTERTRGEPKRTLILNGDKRMWWSLDPATKTYWSEPVPQKLLAAKRDALKWGLLGGDFEAGLSRLGFSVRRLGIESVSGYPCEKSVVEGTGFKATRWFSKRLDFALKLEVTVRSSWGSATSTQVYKNIREGRLSASLFEPPKDYREVPRPPLPTKTSDGRG